MQSVHMLTINEQMQSDGDLIEAIWRAVSYFPKGVWEGVHYIGNVALKKELEIEDEDGFLGAFLFSHLLRKIRNMRKRYEVKDLLLGVTHDPVLVVYYRLEADTFMRVSNLVHDYVTNDVGIISLFKTEEDVIKKLAAHGLGHNQGLKHHFEPVDLMYEGLLHGQPIRIDGFCPECQRKLKRRAE